MLSLLNEWSTNNEKLLEMKNHFDNSSPFPFVVIPNFFKSNVAEEIYNSFPKIEGCDKKLWKNQGWHIYDNPIEGKLTIDDYKIMNNYGEILSNMWETLESSDFIETISNITGIENLEKDPYRHGAGLHCHPPDGKLEMHLDYSIHPITGKERRLNLLIYMNKEWCNEWGGNLELWEGNNDRMTNGPIHSISPKYNHAILFRTSDVSWHGMPEPIKCPIGNSRKSIAIYYVSENRKDANKRNKASFQARPTDPIRENKNIFELYDKLCFIRSTRRLTDDDVAKLLPSWKPRW
jgi:Rps23 Pro-64 3,4-dihydroxylase Tpa1-like proline 4-hydroxylase